VCMRERERQRGRVCVRESEIESGWVYCVDNGVCLSLSLIHNIIRRGV